MSDIVVRLLELANLHGLGGYNYLEGALEIERLRSRVEALEAALQGSQAEVRRLCVIQAGCPADIREAGWSAAYGRSEDPEAEPGRQICRRFEADDGRKVSAHGATDAEALNKIRQQIGIPAK